MIFSRSWEWLCVCVRVYVRSVFVGWMWSPCRTIIKSVLYCNRLFWMVAPFCLPGAEGRTWASSFSLSFLRSKRWYSTKALLSRQGSNSRHYNVIISVLISLQLLLLLLLLLFCMCWWVEEMLTLGLHCIMGSRWSHYQGWGESVRSGCGATVDDWNCLYTGDAVLRQRGITPDLRCMSMMKL